MYLQLVPTSLNVILFRCAWCSDGWQHDGHNYCFSGVNRYGLQNRLFAICDKLSQDLECYVVAIDCLRGETKVGHLDDFMDWLRGHPFDRESDNVSEKCHPVSEDMECTLEYLSRTFSINPSNSNIGLIGFCWGVWAITKACSMLECNEKHGNNGKRTSSSWNVKCGVGFHPSLKFEDVAFYRNQVEMAKSAAGNVPLLYLVAGNDADNIKPPKGEIAKVISDSGNIHCEGRETNRDQLPRCVEFPDMMHGWVSRGDTSLGEVKKGAEDALMMAVEFFRVWM